MFSFSVASGCIERSITLIVVQGHRQEYNLNYFEIFSIVAKMSLIHILLTIVISKSWNIQQLDISNVFLHSNFDTIVYMHNLLGSLILSIPNMYACWTKPYEVLNRHLGSGSLYFLIISTLLDLLRVWPIHLYFSIPKRVFNYTFF